MTAPAIARLTPGGRLWALGALHGDDRVLEVLAGTLLAGWQRGDKLVVLGNMLGANGDPARTIDLLLLLRRRLLAANLACDVFFLRGAQEEMWHKVLQLQFAMSPLDVLDWMLARGLMATIEAYGHSVAEGRIASRNGPSAIARWTAGLRRRHIEQPGHPDLLNSLMRAALSADGRIVFAAAGADPARPLNEQADAFWWNGASDGALDHALGQARDGGWPAIDRLVRGTGPTNNAADESGRVLTVARDHPTLVGLDADGAVLERVEP